MHALISLLVLAALAAPPQAKPRARDLGVPFEGTPGPLNAITDVAGVEVGLVTLVDGEMTGTTWVKESGFLEGGRAPGTD